MTAIITTTKKFMLAGELRSSSEYFVRVDTNNLSSMMMSELYEMKADITRYSDHWSVRLDREYIKTIQFVDNE
jgi:uncharacterized protein YegP (UPF0339 family)